VINVAGELTTFLNLHMKQRTSFAVASIIDHC